MGGADGRKFPLCPYCYNQPPFEDVKLVGPNTPGARSGMPCTVCPHPACPNSAVAMSVTACAECDEVRAVHRVVNRGPFVDIDYFTLYSAAHSRLPCDHCPIDLISCFVALPSQGQLVLDPISHPHWRLDCNRCDFLLTLPPDLHRVNILRDETCNEW